MPRFALLVAAAALIAPFAIACAQPVLITAPQTLNPGATTITPTAGGPPVALETADITVRGTTWTVNGRHTVRSLVVEQSGVLTHTPAFTHDYSGGKGTDVVNGLWLNVQAHQGMGGTMTVTGSGRIDVSGKGYPAAQGPGAGGEDTDGGGNCPTSMSGGGGHGGSGGDGATPATGGAVYGTFDQPTTMGSGGGSSYGYVGSAGGGVVRLVVDGTLTVGNSGVINANGNNGAGYGGGGAGGSIWITAGTLAGSGSPTAIYANGGNACQGYGGGGGGRIAIYADTITITGARQVVGQSWGGAGSVYYAISGQSPQLVYDNFATFAGPTILTEPLLVNGDLIIRGQAVLAAALATSEYAFEADNITVDSQGSITHLARNANGVAVHARGNMTVTGGGKVDVMGKGYAGGEGPGAGGEDTDGGGNCPTSMSGGGGHGGSGGDGATPATGGAVYGTFDQPTTMGSGGGSSYGYVGSAGGGVVRLVVDGTLTVGNSGVINANGNNGAGYGGGGAGGSIWITAGTLAGSGSPTAIYANGGNACQGYGGGGGGRIAIYRCNSSLPSSSVQAVRGANGSDGTIHTNTDALAIRYLGEPPRCRGDSVSITAITAAPTSFQWLRNGVDLADGPSGFGSFISGAQTATLTITNVQANDRGPYTVRVNNACGLVTSAPLNMTLCAADHNCDGTVNSTDVSDFINQWFQDQLDGTLLTDWDANGVVNSTDVSAFINSWFEDSTSGCG